MKAIDETVATTVTDGAAMTTVTASDRPTATAQTGQPAGSSTPLTPLPAAPTAATRAGDRLAAFLLAVKVFSASRPGFSNWRTALVSFVAAPILNVLFLVSFAAVMGSTDLVMTAYAAVLIDAVAQMTGSVASSVTVDRTLGLTQEVVGRRLFDLPLWLARVLVPAAVTFVTAAASAAAILALDPAHDGRLFAATLALTLVGLLVGSGLGVFCALVCLGSGDPYMAGNILTALLPITAGVLAPLASYPAWARLLCHLLPGSGLVDALRSLGVVSSAPGWAVMGLPLLADLGLGLVYLLVGLVLARHLLTAIRAGRRSADVF